MDICGLNVVASTSRSPPKSGWLQFAHLWLQALEGANRSHPPQLFEARVDKLGQQASGWPVINFGFVVVVVVLWGK